MKDQLLERLRPFGQEHLLEFWEGLSSDQRNRLAAQIEQVDFDSLGDLVQGEEDATDWATLASRAQPPQAIRLGRDENLFSAEAARSRGEAALRGGQVAMILVAGGQGTRLGFDHPKGMFPLGPLSNRTLFQILIERLLAISSRYRASIPLYLMTSPATHEETVQFFQEQNRFGLPDEDFRIFCQGVMPAAELKGGRLLLAERGSLFLSPDGHGGMLAALTRSGCLQDARQRGIELLFYGQVDNPLLRVCDPLLLGYHLLTHSEMTTQVVEKAEPLERVGNVVDINGQTRIIEYSDLPNEIARQTNPDGTLRLWAGNLAVHVFDLEFLARVAQQADVLPFHRARKKASFVDPQGQLVVPKEPNAVKFERFIFDLLPAARGAIVVEADKDEAFAPVKNANDEPSDTPRTAQRAMIRRDTALLRQAGADVADEVVVEINPLWALDADELARKIEPGMRVTEPTYFCGEQSEEALF